MSPEALYMLRAMFKGFCVASRTWGNAPYISPHRAWICSDGYPVMGPGAVQVVYTGKEKRLLDCNFPHGFDADYSSNDYAAPEPAPMDNAPVPSSGVRGLTSAVDERERGLPKV